MGSLAVADKVSATSGTPDYARNRQTRISIGDLAIDLETRGVLVHNKPVRLTGKEYCILELLGLHKNTTVTKEIFLKHLYGESDEPAMKIIDVFVCKLRKKLAEASGGHRYIETVWGRGYRMRGAG